MSNERQEETVEEQETVADVLREMRSNEFDDPRFGRDGLWAARRLARDWADRIEAAEKREHKKLLASPKTWKECAEKARTSWNDVY